MYAAQLADVVRACRTGSDPIASSAVGRTALSIVEQAYRHAAEVR
jgi:predicted dehydrogenase